MAKFSFKFLLFILPFIISILPFFIFDPFRILYRYDNYFEGNFVMPNRDYVSSEVFLKNKSTYSYDSFIFGSSRTMGFKTKSWKQYFPNSVSPFVFDGLNESMAYTKKLPI